MAEWTEPVFDRTIEDVVSAITQINEWKTTNIGGITMLKGCLNVTDINRIEDNIAFLTNELSALYYFPRTTSKSWAMEKLPNAKDVERIISNISKIITEFFQIPEAPELPDTMLTYEQINSLEENLYHIKNILDNMVEMFRECNTFECGEE